jgi:S1-C subfamily serine protease
MTCTSSFSRNLPGRGAYFPARRAAAFLLLAGGLLLVTPFADASDPPRPLREEDGRSLLSAVDQANQSIVTVIGYPMRYGPPRPGKKLKRLIGSAVVLSEHRLVTTASMAFPGGRLSVLLGGGVEREARLLGVDRASNIALFEVETAALPALRRAPPQSAAIGTWVAVISNVAITRPQAALGRVIGRGERIDFPHAGDVVEIDAPTYLGSTGAAVLNESGEWLALVVGRAQMLQGDEEGVDSDAARLGETLPQPNTLLLALPVDQVERITEDLAAYGSVRQAFLGVGLVVGSSDSLGVRVVRVWPDSPAALAGIRVDDRIVAMEGREVREPQEITALVRSMRPGEEITLTLLRDTEILAVRALLGATGAAPSVRSPRADQIRTIRGQLDSLTGESKRLEERLRALEGAPRR